MALKRLDILQNQCDTLLNKLRSVEYQLRDRGINRREGEYLGLESFT